MANICIANIPFYSAGYLFALLLMPFHELMFLILFWSNKFVSMKAHKPKKKKLTNIQRSDIARCLHLYGLIQNTKVCVTRKQAVAGKTSARPSEGPQKDADSTKHFVETSGSLPSKCWDTMLRDRPSWLKGIPDMLYDTHTYISTHTHRVTGFLCTLLRGKCETL